AYVAQIDSLVVDENVRGLAVGAQLVQHAVDLAKERDADVVELGSRNEITCAFRTLHRPVTCDDALDHVFVTSLRPLGSALTRTRALRFYQREKFQFTSRKLVRPLKPVAH
ncbi:GNAT family N-acetyltransferase, partial [Frankia sp. CcWB3]